MRKIQPLRDTMKLDPPKLARVMESIVTDSSFRQQLEERPIETLQAIGVVLEDNIDAELLGQRLSQLIPIAPISLGSDRMNVTVAISPEVGVDIIVSIAVESKLSMADLADEIVFEREIAIQKTIRDMHIGARFEHT